MSDSSAIDKLQDVLRSRNLKLSDVFRSGGIPRDSSVVCQPQAQAQAQAHMQVKLEVPTAHFDRFKWYFGSGPGTLSDCDVYIDAAFRSSEGKAYLFMGKEYLLLDCTQGLSLAKVLEGPQPICKGFPFLRYTPFADCGLTCAFGSGEDEAFIFSGNRCAKINYGSNPSYYMKAITVIFPFLQWTPFKNGADAAFEWWRSNEAYLFKNDMCARINYSSDEGRFVSDISPITEVFPVLKGTFFDSKIQAAFALRRTDRCYEVLLFKEDCCAWMKFGRPTEPLATPRIYIGKMFPPLLGILPRKISGLDGYDESNMSGSTRIIYNKTEGDWLEVALKRAISMWKCIATADLYRSMKEAEANKVDIWDVKFIDTVINNSRNLMEDKLDWPNFVLRRPSPVATSSPM